MAYSCCFGFRDLEFPDFLYKYFLNINFWGLYHKALRVRILRVRNYGLKFRSQNLPVVMGGVS